MWQHNLLTWLWFSWKRWVAGRQIWRMGQVMSKGDIGLAKYCFQCALCSWRRAIVNFSLRSPVANMKPGDEFTGQIQAVDFSTKIAITYSVLDRNPPSITSHEPPYKSQVSLLENLLCPLCQFEKCMRNCGYRTLSGDAVGEIDQI